MKEIKFRAWSGSVMFGDVDLVNGNPYLTDGGYYELFSDREIIGGIVMQYTGLKDKNGKEIFESDILDIRYQIIDRSLYSTDNDDDGVYRGVVHFQPSTGYMLKKVKKLSDYSESQKWEKRANLERIRQSTSSVIGNIYQNPELLEP